MNQRANICIWLNAIKFLNSTENKL